MKINSIITPENIIVNYNGQTHMVSRSDEVAEKILLALKEKRNDDIPNLISVHEKIKNFSKGEFVVENGRVMIEGKAVSIVLSKKIIDFANENLPYEPLLKFAKNVQQNPSFRAVNELYLFLEKNNHPITEDGNFIAYKKVGKDFKDLYTHSIDNNPGTIVAVPRNEVNEDCNVTCSYGLHVANWDYAKFHYGGANDLMLEVEVNPKDVVAVPIDYNNAKMRVCEYKVIGVVDIENSSHTLYQSSVVKEEDDDEEYVDDDEEEDELY
jgi:hypothetical protein